MKQNRLTRLLLTVVCVVFLAGIAFAGQGKGSDDKKIYTPDCPADCPSASVSTEPGKCACGKDLVEHKVLKEDGENYYVCACGAECNCSGMTEDGSKCACGKDLKAYAKTKKGGCGCGKKKKKCK